jgi:hypothetical protein
MSISYRVWHGKLIKSVNRILQLITFYENNCIKPEIMSWLDLILLLTIKQTKKDLILLNNKFSHGIIYTFRWNKLFTGNSIQKVG